jgi:hypothetical protein
MRSGKQRVFWAGGVIFLAVLIGFWLPPGFSFGTQRAAPVRNSEARKVEIRLSLSKTAYVLSEDISLTVSVINSGSAPIEIPDPFYRDNWQPTYTLLGPAYPEGYTFSFRSAVLKDRTPEPASPAHLVKLSAGETLQKNVPLTDWVPINTPGNYQISAKLAWKDLASGSNVVEFRVGRSDVLFMSVGVDVGDASTPGDWVEWLHRENQSPHVYSALFKRPHVDVRGYEPFSVSPVFSAGQDAADILSPWTNYDRQSDVIKWRAWREGAALVALATGFNAAQRLELGAVPRMIVRPALMTSDGLLDIFVTSADGNSLMLGRFPKPNFAGRQAAAAVSWRVPVPLPALAGRCALGPESGNSRRHVMLVAQGANSLALFYLNAGDGKNPGVWHTVNIPKGHAIDGSEPGLNVDANGIVNAAVLFESDSQAHRLAIVDMRFSPDGNLLAEPRITELGPLPGPPQAATAGYVVSADGAPRRDWVVLLRNGTVIHSGNPERPEPLEAAPAIPLELVSLASSAYLLTTDPSGKPGFTQLK